MQVLYSTNPLNPFGDCKKFDAPEGATPNQVIQHFNWRFVRPTILLVNGEAWGRAQWNSPLPADRSVLFVECPGEPGTIIIIVLILGLAVGAYLYANSQTPNDSGVGKTVYSFSAGNNQLRLGSPFVEHFGRFRAYPDLAQQSYIQNVDNDQYMYFLGILGVGEYDVEGVFIDQTPLTDYADAEYNILAPGDTPTLIPVLVWTSNEVSNQELKTDWVTYVVSAPLTEIDYVEYDITFPGGLLRIDNDGDPAGVTVTIQTEVRTVDDFGDPISGWTTLESRSYSASSKDPLRFSRKLAAPLGMARYEFRARRTSASSQKSTTMDRAILSGLRGYGAPHPDYGDLTLIEAKIKATDQLNGNAASQINIVATRKLGAVSGSGISGTLTATRSIVDAAAYMVTSENAGKQSVSILDLTGLAALRASLETLEYHFDYRFTERSSVMDAAAKAATCGLSIPCMPGGRFSLIKNESSSPVCAFSADNLRNLEIVITPPTPDTPTCVLVRYTDPDTWDEEIVFCFDEEGSDDTPLEITLDGCTDRQQAFEIGMFLYWQTKFERVGVSFTTGLMGYIPPLLSKVVVPNKNTSWGASGLIMAVDAPKIWLSEPVDFQGESEGKLYITLDNGDISGPYTVEPADEAHCVVGTIAGLKTMETDGLKATRWNFGLSTDQGTDLLLVRVGAVKPSGRDEIKISGTAVNSAVYDNPGAAPAIGTVGGELALLSNFTVVFVEDDSVGDHVYRVTWAGAASSVRIEVDEGSGFVELEDEYEDHSYDFVVSADSFSIKLTPYDESNDIQLGEAITQVIAVPIAPTGLTVVQNSSDGLDVDWNNYTGAAQYFVALKVDDEEIEQISVTVSNASVTFEEIEALGGPWPEYEIVVWALLNDGQLTLPTSVIEEWNS